MTHVVVIGAGFAGVKAVQTLCRRKDVEITLIDRNNYHAFYPLLYQVAANALPEEDITFSIRSIFIGKPNVTFLLSDVIRVDATTRKVITQDTQISYDFLVVATGSDTNFFGDQTLAQHCLTLKSVPQALDIRNRIAFILETADRCKDSCKREKLLRIVIAGAGPTGVELAGALMGIRKHILKKQYKNISPDDFKIYLVDFAPRVLSTFHPGHSAYTENILRKNGVEILTGAHLRAYDGQTVEIEKEGGDILRIETPTLIWTAGIQGVVPEGLDDCIFPRKNRFEVRGNLSVKLHPEIYAVGDACLYIEEKYPQGVPTLASAALQQGKLAAENILRRIEGRPQKEFHYKNPGTMAIIGEGRAVATVGGQDIRGSLGWIMWLGVHLIKLATFRDRASVFVHWGWGYLNKSRISIIYLTDKKCKEK